MVNSLPMNCEILLGQDWLERFGYQFHIPFLGINLPAYSETLVRIPSTEQGNRLVEAQELQDNIFCTSSVVECKHSFLCLIINLNSTDETLKKFPRTSTRLREVFQKLRQFNLKIEPDKCEFLKTEVNYLGHVTSEGVRPDPEKVKAIPIPRNGYSISTMG